MRQLNLTITAGITDLWVQAFDDTPRHVPITSVFLDRWVLRMDDGDPSSGGLNVRIRANGYHEWSGRMPMPPDHTAIEAGVAVELEPSAVPFPPGVKRPWRLEPFDPADGGGTVHTTLPPEQVVPAQPDRNWFRCDIAGVTTPETPPFVPGANTTPPNMWMSFFLPKYPRAWQDYYLDWITTQLGYTHCVVTQDIDGITLPIDLCQRIQAKGLFPCLWTIDISDLPARLAAQSVDVVILGDELNRRFNKPDLDTLIADTCALCNPANVPVWLHFTDNFRPEFNWTTDEFRTRYLGKVAGICWQGAPDDSAGTMGAMLWYVRTFLGQADPSFLCCAFELVATNQLYGRATEQEGNRRSWEMVCSTRNNTNYPPVAGFGNGGCRPDGSVL